MAHYAFLNENNIVTEVIVGVAEDELIEGLDPETWYGNFRGQVCKRTSYNTYLNTHQTGGVPFRKNYACIGYIYHKDFDAFIAPQPYPSWQLNYETYGWEAPISKPEDTLDYFWKWSEINKEWIKIKLDTPRI
jgi:hypothetical protein